MGISPDTLLDLISECTDKNAVLYSYNKRHRLIVLIFGDDSSNYNVKIRRMYLPQSQNSHSLPTLQELFTAFTAYHADLSAAIAIEQFRIQSPSKQK